MLIINTPHLIRQLKNNASFLDLIETVFKEDVIKELDEIRVAHNQVPDILYTIIANINIFKFFKNINQTIQNHILYHQNQI